MYHAGGNMYENFVGKIGKWKKLGRIFRNGGIFWYAFRPRVWRRSMGKGAMKGKGIKFWQNPWKMGEIFDKFS